MPHYHSMQPAFYEKLLDSQYWAPAKRLAEQRENLERVLRHARATIPFYRTRLDPVFTPHGHIDWDRWNDIPILTRSDLLEHREAMQSPEVPTAHGDIHVGTSSGSTGPAVSVSHTYLANMINAAVAFRAQRWHNLDWSRDLLFWLGDKPERGAWPHGTVGPAWGPVWRTEASGRTRELNRLNSAARAVEFIERNKISYVSVRTVTAHALALEAERLGTNLKLDRILLFSNAIYPQMREDVTRVFGARFFLPYSAKEGGQMAHLCAHGEHFHVAEERVLLEILDEDGRPCLPGDVGRIVITPLFDYAQPLIRYEQGDLGSLGEGCAGGITLPVLNTVVGRIAHLFRFPDGSRVAMSLQPEVAAAFGAKFWQIAQVAPLKIEVRYVPEGAGIGDERALADLIRTKTHPDVEVVFIPKDDLVRDDGRKFIEYVCELPSDGS